jgi:hypothetical protein
MWPVIVGLNLGANATISQLYVEDSRGYTSLHSATYLTIEDAQVFLV